MAGQWVRRERGVERGYGSARARAEQSGEHGKVRGWRKGKVLPVGLASQRDGEGRGQRGASGCNGRARAAEGS